MNLLLFKIENDQFIVFYSYKEIVAVEVFKQEQLQKGIDTLTGDDEITADTLVTKKTLDTFFIRVKNIQYKKRINKTIVNYIIKNIKKVCGNKNKIVWNFLGDYVKSTSISSKNSEKLVLNLIQTQAPNFFFDQIIMWTTSMPTFHPDVPLDDIFTDSSLNSFFAEISTHLKDIQEEPCLDKKKSKQIEFERYVNGHKGLTKQLFAETFSDKDGSDKGGDSDKNDS